VANELDDTYVYQQVQRRLHLHLWEHWKRTGITPITEDTPIEDADELVDAREVVTDALWMDRGSLAELKQRAVDLRNAGEAECRKKCAAPPTNLRRAYRSYLALSAHTRGYFSPRLTCPDTPPQLPRPSPHSPPPPPPLLSPPSRPSRPAATCAATTNGASGSSTSSSRTSC